jgi:arsenite methyltransferase
VAELRDLLHNAGFIDIVIQDKDNSDEIIKSWNFGEGVEKMVFSAYIQAKRPKKG